MIENAQYYLSNNTFFQNYEAIKDPLLLLQQKEKLL